jgi:hypothetical protein
MSSGSDNVTQIDLSYLHKLKTRLSAMQTQVEDQIRGQGASFDPATTPWIGPVDATLTVRAGGAGTGAGSTFDIATALTSALAAMGGSIHDQLAWLDTTLGGMIAEITATVNSFGTTESTNNEAMDKLISEFQTTISAIRKDPSLAGLPGLS